MIKINADFEIEHTTQCWVLYQYYDGLDKGGNPIRRKNITYYSTLANVCAAVIDKSAGLACEQAKDIIAAVQAAESDIFKAIHAPGLK